MHKFPVPSTGPGTNFLRYDGIIPRNASVIIWPILTMYLHKLIIHTIEISNLSFFNKRSLQIYYIVT